MPRYAHRIPGLKLHKPSGNAYVRLDGRMVYCGRHGSAESQTRYERAVAECLGRDRTPAAAGPSPIVAEVLSAFMRHAMAYYRSPTGEPTGKARNFADAIKPLHRLYDDLPAKDFTAGELKAVRGAMVADGLARKTINTRVNRLRRIWKWAAAEGMVPASVYVELQTLDPLRRNRTEAREAPRVVPVAEERVRATLPHLPRPVAAMVELQLLTGCRVGEVLAMRGGEIDRTVEPWEYRPGSHKNDHRGDGRNRVTPPGPRARAILGPFMGCEPDPTSSTRGRLRPTPSGLRARSAGPRVEFVLATTAGHTARRSGEAATGRSCTPCFPRSRVLGRTS